MTKKAIKPTIPIAVNPAVPDGEVYIIGRGEAFGPIITGKIIGLDTASKTDETAKLCLLNVRGCSACGGNHDGVIELPLPAPAAEDIRHTHFFFCPTTGQRVTIEHKE